MWWPWNCFCCWTDWDLTHESSQSLPLNLARSIWPHGKHEPSLPFLACSARSHRDINQKTQTLCCCGCIKLLMHNKSTLSVLSHGPILRCLNPPLVSSCRVEVIRIWQAVLSIPMFGPSWNWNWGTPCDNHIVQDHPMGTTCNMACTQLEGSWPGRSDVSTISCLSSCKGAGGILNKDPKLQEEVANCKNTLGCRTKKYIISPCLGLKLLPRKIPSPTKAVAAAWRLNWFLDDLAFIWTLQIWWRHKKGW